MARQSQIRRRSPLLAALATGLVWGSCQWTFASPSAGVQHESSTALTRSSGARTAWATGSLPRDHSSVTTAAAAAAAPNFFSKVFAAGAQGATAAFVAAILSAICEPLVNRLLVKRMTISEALKEMNFKLISNFFLTTFPTNMLKFPVFEIINMAMTFTAFSPGMSGTISGFLFCTAMLPVTNYRFRKSMGWEIKPALLYQAYVPTVVRDILYGWARGFVAVALSAVWKPQTFVQEARLVCGDVCLARLGFVSREAFVFAFVIWAACSLTARSEKTGWQTESMAGAWGIISSPCNEWRGYTLQPKDKKLSFGEYFKPINYARSTGIGATIMGISLFVGRLVTPFAETAFAYLKGHPVAGVAALAILVGGFKLIAGGEEEKEEEK
ncbi:mco [Symbiodinium sp. CCMP2592]|nr:mco [Symbiodinium sp. CCMP2592]